MVYLSIVHTHTNTHFIYSRSHTRHLEMAALALPSVHCNKQRLEGHMYIVCTLFIYFLHTCVYTSQCTTLCVHCQVAIVITCHVTNSIIFTCNY